VVYSLTMRKHSFSSASLNQRLSSQEAARNSSQANCVRPPASIS